MATTRRASQLLLLAVALALVLLVGSADAWQPCKQGYKSCKAGNPQGCETCIETDPYNCGDCHIVCKWGEKCKNGKCVQPPPKCKPGYGDCDGNPWNGCETNLENDPYNCGKCHYKCPCTLKWGEPTCNWGKCGQQCKQGWFYDNVKKCCVVRS